MTFCSAVTSKTHRTWKENKRREGGKGLLSIFVCVRNVVGEKTINVAISLGEDVRSREANGQICQDAGVSLSPAWIS